MEIERTDFHISSAPTTAANLTQFKTRKEPFPVRLTFAPFRLILRLEKTGGNACGTKVIGNLNKDNGIYFGAASINSRINATVSTGRSSINQCPAPATTAS